MNTLTLPNNKTISVETGSQIDDILDFDGNYDTCELNSYVKVHGIEKAREDALAHIEYAGKVLEKLNEKGFCTDNFRYLLDFLIKRMK